MEEELGKIKKPNADKVMGKKKAFICVLLQAPQEASKELHDLIFNYWEAVDKNISNLEEKTGVVNKIFVEGIPGSGEDVAINLKEASIGAWNITEERRKTGAKFSELENLEILQKVIDWSKCLNSGLTNRSVAEKISEELKNESQARIDFIKSSLDKNLEDGESAIIFTGNQEISIPEDVEKFIISPPELDLVAQWVKKAQEAMEAQMKEQYEAQAKAQSAASSQNDETSNSSSEKPDSGLWTPN
ncbi:MAG: hypothetical protein GWO78_02155 [Dehalococcoidales bacterium]|nr:hypothetical protein [Dehalococcoidales bacterium]